MLFVWCNSNYTSGTRRVGTIFFFFFFLRGGVLVTKSLVFCTLFCRSLSICYFFFGLRIFALLRFTASDYLFCIFTQFLFPFYIRVTSYRAFTFQKLTKLFFLQIRHNGIFLTCTLIATSYVC
jgi:hypothetical protein